MRSITIFVVCSMLMICLIVFIISKMFSKFTFTSARIVVFTLNTTVFAEEVAVDSVDDAVEATVDAVDEVADEATVDNTDDSVAATENVQEAWGIKYTEKDGNYTAVTTIDYASNGEKKNEKFDVATIKNTTDPVSWNNYYAADLIATVLYGSKGDDEWLNNSSKVTVSTNKPGSTGEANIHVDNLRNDNDDRIYKVIPVVEGSQYIFVGYGVADWNGARFVYGSDYVNGQDEVIDSAYGETEVAVTPLVEWDGRQIDFNKSGDHKFTTGKKEALDVAVAFVTYNNGEVKEVNGVNAGTVKVDKKAQKAASVAFDTQAASKTVKEWTTKDGKEVLGDVTNYILEHKTRGDLPFFTIKPGVKGDAKEYKKAITEKFKDKKFYFGIMQHAVSVTAGAAGATDPALSDVIDAYKDLETVSDPNVLSANDIKLAEDAIADAMTDGKYTDMDTDKVVLDDFEVTKFTDKGATVTLQGYVGEKKSYKKENLKALSGKGKNQDYSLESGSVANTGVSYLKFVDDGNFLYRPLTLTITDDKGTTARTYTNNGDLAPAGFKWAFRKSPVEKSKKFRYGIYKSTNQGFVYSVDETAVDSVEEAF